MGAVSSPELEALMEYCGALPGASPARRWGETVYRVGSRVFAFLDARRPGVTVKATPAARAALVSPAVRRARWVGRFGWMTVRVSDPESLQLALRLVDESYAAVARRARE
jgi:predicted DNA-binding protein (MmcQ/YjbR family)